MMIVFLKHKGYISNVFIAICAFTCLHRVVVQAMNKPRLTISAGVSQAICTSTAKYMKSRTIQGPHKDPSKFPTNSKSKCEKLQWNKLCVSGKRCLTFACRSSSSTRIVGGMDALPHEFPHQTYFKTMSFKGVVCGGSVLNENYVITAAHCFEEQDPLNYTVVAGGHSISGRSDKEQERKIKKLISHEDYHGDDNDIALVEVDPPFDLTDAVAPVLLPMPNYNATGDATASGWGRLKERDGDNLPDILQKVTMPIITNAECKDAYTWQGEIYPSNICAGFLGVGGKAPCYGDSGGPFVIKMANGSYLLIGITSWGIGCADPRYPAVYTKVATYIDWIYKNSGIKP